MKQISKNFDWYKSIEQGTNDFLVSYSSNGSIMITYFEDGQYRNSVEIPMEHLLTVVFRIEELNDQLRDKEFNKELKETSL